MPRTLMRGPIVRCGWARNELSIRYHDEERGVPQHDDRKLFEFLILEGALAGLSWDTILRKRENYRAAFRNARAFLAVQEACGSFDRYVWQFIGDATHKRRAFSEAGSSTQEESDAMSKDLRKCGFNFVGSSICYAFMQAVGMVNDHLVSCFRFNALQGNT